jgi:4-hydroxybenzoate polyprenyltransferase
MAVWLGRARALRVSWALHLSAMVALAWTLVLASDEVHREVMRASNPLGPAATAIFFAATVVLLWLEQRWAENVNLAFFKTNVAVGFVVLLAVLAARMTGGGF